MNAPDPAAASGTSPDRSAPRAQIDPANLRVDRTVLTVVTQEEADQEHYWWDKTIEERWEGIEINRRIVYGYGESSPRLQRVLEVARR